MGAEDGGKGGAEGGASPGGSSSVRFARGVAGESAARGEEGARFFGARSSSICSDGGCCKGYCGATVVVGFGGGSGSGGIKL